MVVLFDIKYLKKYFILFVVVIYLIIDKNPFIWEMGFQSKIFGNFNKFLKLFNSFFRIKMKEPMFKTSRKYLGLQKKFIILFFFRLLLNFFNFHERVGESTNKPWRWSKNLIEEVIQCKQLRTEWGRHLQFEAIAFRSRMT